MEFIQHRINTIKELRSIKNSSFGVEIDVRYHDDTLILSHDPFYNEMIKFEDWLKEYRLEGILILNIKSEGLEAECIRLMKKFNIKNYFFLDLSLPYLVKYSDKENFTKEFNENNLAIRYSKYEPIELVLKFKGRARWVWIDCFDGEFILTKSDYDILRANNFKICIVSPELQGKSRDLITEHKKIIKEHNFIIDAVCSKDSSLWI